MHFVIIKRIKQMYGIEIPKQRGIYSEILTTEDTENIRQVSTYGPQNKNALLTVNKVQSKPRALGKFLKNPPFPNLVPSLLKNARK